MATMSLLMLSESADGDGIRIGTASPIDGTDTLLHTAGSGTTNFDRVTLWAYNDHTDPLALHIKWGDTTDPIIHVIPPQAGLVLVTADLQIADGNTIEASAATIDLITVYGSVVRVTA